MNAELNRSDPHANAPARTTPAVSVLLASYNGKQYLSEAVASILQQTFTDFEFLLIDDGSDDGSLALMYQFAQQDARIRLISWANRGLTAALNCGLRLARAPLVARMDADDLASPDRLLKQVAFLNEHPDVALVGSQVLLIDPHGRPIGHKRGLSLDHASIDEALLNGGWPLVHPAVMFRRDEVLSVGGYCDGFQVNQDHDLFLRLAERFRLANHPEVLLRYRLHFQSVSLAKAHKQRETLQRILTAARQRRGLPAAPPFSTGASPKRAGDHRLDWVWTALSAGHVPTARHHARILAATHPLRLSSWKALNAARRGH